MSVACAVPRCSDKGESYTFKAATAIERRRADACYTIGNRYARKSATAIKRIRAYALYTSVQRNDAVFTSQNQGSATCFN